jgi:hypothetical protein
LVAAIVLVISHPCLQLLCAVWSRFGSIGLPTGQQLAEGMCNDDLLDRKVRQDAAAAAAAAQ